MMMFSSGEKNKTHFIGITIKKNNNKKNSCIYTVPICAAQQERGHDEVETICSEMNKQDDRGLLRATFLLLGVFSRAPFDAAAPPLPLGVLAGSVWYWWSESSRANRLFA